MRNRKVVPPTQLQQPDSSWTQISSILDETLKSLQKNESNLASISGLDSFKALRDIFQHQKLQQKSKPQRIFRTIISYWDIILLCSLNLVFISYLVIFLIVYFSPDSSISQSLSEFGTDVFEWLTAEWLYWNEFDDITKEHCALTLPDVLVNVFTPINNCKMCVGLHSIDRVESISREEFVQKYAYTAVPLIVAGAIHNWTAMSVFNFDYLKKLYDVRNKEETPKGVNNGSLLETFNSIVQTDEERQSDPKLKDVCQFFPYRTKFKNLHQVFNMDAARRSEPWYVGWSNCNDFAGKEMRKHYTKPSFLPENSESSKIDWIFMGTPGYGAQIHIDNVNHPSWQAQISGEKLWTFKPPAECMFKCETLEALVLPGDIIIFDSNQWYHATRIMGKDLSLTIGSEYD